jgi:hypothetical protein
MLPLTLTLLPSGHDVEALSGDDEASDAESDVLRNDAGSDGEFDVIDGTHIAAKRQKTPFIKTVAGQRKRKGNDDSTLQKRLQPAIKKTKKTVSTKKNLELHHPRQRTQWNVYSQVGMRRQNMGCHLGECQIPNNRQKSYV